MTEAAASSRPGVPSDEELLRLFELLRDEGYQLVPQQLEAARVILERARAEGPDGLTARRLPFHLTPVFASTPSQQADLYRRIEAWRGPAVKVRMAPAEVPRPTAPPLPPPLQQGRIWPVAAGTAALLACVTAAVWLAQLSRPIPPPIEQPAPTPSPVGVTAGPTTKTAVSVVLAPSYVAVKWLLILSPLAALGGWLFLRWRWRRLWLQHGRPQGKPDPLDLGRWTADAALFAGPEMAVTAQQWLRFRRIPTRDLDPERTIDATLAAAGLFIPRYRARPVSPDYVLLIEEKTRHDHLARLADLAADRLEAEGVALERYYVTGSIDHLRRADTRGERMPLAEVASRSPHRTLVFVGQGEALFDPLGTRLSARASRALEDWPHRALLSTKPVGAWSDRELALVEDGVALATAGRSGLRAFGDYVASPRHEEDRLLEGVLVDRGGAVEPPPSPPAEAAALASLLATLRERLQAAIDEAVGHEGGLSSLLHELLGQLGDRASLPAALNTLGKLRESAQLPALDMPKLIAAIHAALIPPPETPQRRERPPADRLAAEDRAALERTGIRQASPADTALTPSMIFRDIDAPWCPEMVVIPAGRFSMGSPYYEKGRTSTEWPRHVVQVDRPFALGRHTVTFEEYDYFCEETRRERPDDNGWGRGRRPVINVTWKDAAVYCAWLSELTSRQYQLPSEAQWEYACRAGTKTAFSWGEEANADLANFGDKIGRTVEVGTYAPNQWGLYEMHGNVWEWCADNWHGSYEGAPSDGSPWIANGSLSGCVVRGASWNGLPEHARSAMRYWLKPVRRLDILGFRISRMLTL